MGLGAAVTVAVPAKEVRSFLLEQLLRQPPSPNRSSVPTTSWSSGTPSWSNRVISSRILALGAILGMGLGSPFCSARSWCLPTPLG
jgi:hypothetical protein